MQKTKIFNRIEKNGSRYYKTDLGEFPSVSTVLEKTMPDDERRRINHWRIESAKKIHRQFRKCVNCCHYEPDDNSCNGGAKLRSDIHKKNRCSAYMAKASVLSQIEEAKAKPRQRGTDVHKHIENYFDNYIIPPPEVCQFSDKIAPLLKVLDPIYVEKEIYSVNHKYAGTLDFIGNYRDEVCLIDWTTSLHIKPVQYYERKFLQSAGYAIAAEENLGVKVERMAVVVMSKSEAKWIDVDFSYREKFLDRVRMFYG